MRIIISTIIIFLCLSIKAQIKDIDTSYERIVKLPTGIANLKSGKVIDGNEYGYHYHPDLTYQDDKQGPWIFKDVKQRILAIFWNGSDNRMIIQEQYKKGRLQTRIYYTSEDKYTEDPNLADYVLKYKEIVEFNKKGEAKKRTYLSPTGETIIEKL